MKEERGNSKLFWAEIIIIIGAIFLSTSLINLLKINVGWSLLIGLILVIIGSAWKSVKK